MQGGTAVRMSRNKYEEKEEEKKYGRGIEEAAKAYKRSPLTEP